MPEEQPRKTATDTLIAAVEKADEMEDVIIIWSQKPNAEGVVSHSSLDNDVTISDAIFLIEFYKLWIMRHVVPDE